MKFYVLLLFLAFGKLGSSIEFEDCGSEYYLDEVEIEGCTELPCCLFLGEQHRINMKVFSSFRSENLHQQSYLVIKTIQVELEVTPDDLCDQVTCPVSNDYDVSFSAVMNVNQSFVPLEADLYWKIRNEEGLAVLCMRTDVILRDRNKPEDNEMCK
ncbi:NPC intracellular cholesterol transporter 2 [Onthophagus taurus]|uniref:NPC intracellular cholesterol transporter 2 n=1 Tax=Onthophagus taurus TaxID=166361 RepID=UPI000C20C710|nr:epididymal secretory protein E1 [Onthophagus taurus]